jgi:hypothetical protein
MLWSKSFVDTDSACPSQSVRLRAGDTGPSWGGYSVGSHVHNVIQSLITKEDQPASDHLSVMELVAAERLVSNFKEMEIKIPEIPLSKCEHSLVVDVHEDGSVTPRDTPSWAIRGDNWDPSRAAGETLFRIQPDLFFVEEDGSIVVYDWKTAWGMPADSRLEKDVQAITYAAVLAVLHPNAPSIKFIWWNIRYKRGHMIDRSTEEWTALAAPIFKACYARDKQPQAAIQEDTRPGEHCGRCPFTADCLVEMDEPMEDGDLYRYSQRLAELSRGVRSNLNQRLKERTGVLELDGGVKLGPINKTYQRWDKGKKSSGMREAFEELRHTDGTDPFEFFDVKGSLGEWIKSLPEHVRLAVEPHIAESNRQVFIEKE